ncbi:hypothetical protein [Streptomyces sp. NPDC006971]|uniref:DUF6923 family protein n=1 Tax=Streptomyces sp. NPDC006971 TaxID=3154784 RepID=UPI0033DCEA77
MKALVFTAGAVVMPFAIASQAQAASGDPFDPADPTVFVAQDIPTRLYKAVTGASGSVTFQPEGSASTVTYNAIGYNTADNYLYGVASGGSHPAGSIVRIGQGGVVTRVGTDVVPVSANWGSFGPDGGFFVGTSTTDTAYRIDVATGKITASIKLPLVPPTPGLTYADGYFWGASPSGQLVRVDLLGAAKTVTTFSPAVLTPGKGFGAAWTFGNGNIGFSESESGLVSQVKIANPGSANPTFTLVSTSPGPASMLSNDGAASPGLPTDLSVAKSGPETLKPGTAVTYTLKVKNNGPGNASGYTVSDSVPAPLTNVKTTTPGCTVSGNTVACVGGRTLAGVENTITITADSPATMTGCVTNTGTVLANEEDPTSGNNQSSVKSCAEEPGLTVKKSASAEKLVAGEEIIYKFAVTNTGNVTLEDVKVNEGEFTGSGKLSPVTCPDEATSLVPGKTMTCTATYTVTQADIDAGSIKNSATGTPPGGTEPPVSPPSEVTVPAPADPALTVTKTAEIKTPGELVAGEKVEYAFLVKNTGNVTLKDVKVKEGDFTGSGKLSDVVCPAGAGSLAPGASVTCTASYEVTQADVDAGRPSLRVWP